MNGLPYYKAYPRDFIEGTIGMSFELKGAYRLVLDLIYMQGGELPDDPRYISGLIGCSVKKWNSLRSALVDMGKIQVSGKFLTNYRAITELESLRKLQGKQSENRSRPNKNKDLKSPNIDHTEPEPDIRKKDTPPIDPPLPEQPTVPSSDGPDEKEKPDGRKRPKKGTRLPPDWEPDDKCCSFARNVGLDPGRVADEFRDYWHSVPGNRGSKLDWSATWRNWCRRSLDYGAHSGAPTKSTGNQQSTASWAQASRNVLERIERAASGEQADPFAEEGPCIDHEEEGGSGRHGDNDRSLFGEIIPLSSRYRSTRS